MPCFNRECLQMIAHEGNDDLMISRMAVKLAGSVVEYR